MPRHLDDKDLHDLCIQARAAGRAQAEIDLTHVTAREVARGPFKGRTLLTAREALAASALLAKYGEPYALVDALDLDEGERVREAFENAYIGIGLDALRAEQA